MRGLCLVCGLLLLSSCTSGTDTEPTPPPDPDADILKAKFDPASVGSVLAYVTSDNDAYVKDLIELASIPSISALPAHSNDVLEAAGWLKTRLAAAGLENVQVLHTEGPQPVVGGTLSGCIVLCSTILISRVCLCIPLMKQLCFQPTHPMLPLPTCVVPSASWPTPTPSPTSFPH